MELDKFSICFLRGKSRFDSLYIRSQVNALNCKCISTENGRFPGKRVNNSHELYFLIIELSPLSLCVAVSAHNIVGGHTQRN